MTFEVYLDNQLLFYPNDESCVITEAVVTNSLNEAGTFQCNVPQNNPLYIGLENKVRSSMLQVKQNGKEIFYGEVREVKQNFNMTKQVYAVGELAFLFDSIQPQAKYQTTPYAMMKSLIDKHNSQVEAKKKFNIGYVTVKDSNDYVYRFTNYEDTLSAIRDKLCDALDGYLRIRKVNGTRYLDLVRLEDYGAYCKQEIQFGENLLDYSCNTTASEIATAVIPLGARLDDESRTKEAIDGLDEYTTIKGTEVYQVNGKEQTYSYDKDYVFNQTAVNQFGWIKVVKHWDDVTTKRALKAKAEEWIKSVQFAKMELDINAFDGNLLDINVDAFEVGDTVHAWALPYGMDTTFPVRKKTTYINDVSKNLITLGTTASTSYTSQASKALNVVEEQLPEESEILRNAKQNALSMLTDPTKGYVTYIFDNKGNRTEIWIADSLDQDEMTKKWVWNSSGLGYLYKKNGNWVTDIAMTMDGAIVADRITTGIMSADRMRGGELIIGGPQYLNNKNNPAFSGKISVRNSSNQDIFVADKTGVTITGYATDDDISDMTTNDALSKGTTTINGGCIKTGNVIVGGKQNSGTNIDGAFIARDANNNEVFRASKDGVVISGYATNSDISDMATKKGLSQGTTTISGGCITTGNVVVGGNTSGTNVDGAIVAKNSSNQEIFRADKNGVTVSGYASSSDISDMATKTGLSQGSTTINGGCISTGTLSAAAIKGGTLTLGGNDNGNGLCSVKDASGNEKVKLDNGGITASAGQIGGFTIGSTNLTVDDAKLSADVIGCGKAGKGIVNLVGDNDGDNSKYGYIQISNSGNPSDCRDGIRIYGNGLVKRYDGSGNVSWEKWLSNLSS